MKKILLLLLFLVGFVMFVVGRTNAQTCNTTITTYPYFENFEAGAAGWTSGGTASSWALGKPAKPVINSAASGTKSWVTNVTGVYNGNERSFVESPCFNTASLTLPVIEMKVWWNSEFSSDGAVLQASIDGGTTWQVVGAYQDPYNWYNDNTINSGPGGQAAATAVGWTGRNTTSNGSGGWVTAKHLLTGLGGQASVKLRIAFASDNIVHDGGFAFDDVRISENPANDAGVTAITNPGTWVQPGVSTPITVSLKNFGTANLTSATLGFSVDGTVISNNYAFNGNVALNQTATGVTIGNYTFQPGNHTVKAWTNLPNGATDGLATNDTTRLQLVSCNSLNGTYSINKTLPASATNYPSFTAAMQALTDCGISGPVVFNVAGGPYSETVSIGNISGASVTNTITINGNGNSLVNPSTSADAFKLTGTKYFRLNNLNIEANASVSGGAIVSLLNGANFNIISGCTLTHNTSITNASYVISLQNGCSSNTFQNNTLIGASYSVYNYGASTALNSNNQFIGNIVKDSYYNGIYLNYAPGSFVEGNDISRPTRTNTGVYYGLNVSSGCTNLVLSKNRVHNTHDAITNTAGTSIYGVYLIPSGIAGQENIVKNNAFYNINNNGGSFYGIYNGGSDNTWIYHNTISADNPNITFVTLRGMHFASAFLNVKFINNNISLASPATTAKHAIYLGALGITLISDNNNLYVGNSGNVGFLNGAGDQANLSAWKTVKNNAYDQASVSADPMYINLATGNLKPGNGPLNNIGQPVASITDDITGAPRSTTTPDPGAFEFTPAQEDAGITAIVNPTSPVIPNVSQPITVTLKNNGVSPLTAVTINWTVNGVAQPAFAWTGNLANNQTANVTIGNYTFTGGAYTLSSCTSNPNGVADANPGNDCANRTLMACNSLTGAYTINKNIAASATNFTSFATAVTQLTNCGVSGPVTISVEPGTGPYNEIVVIGNILGASATNTITFNGNGNLVSSPNASADHVIKLDGAKFIRFNNLKAEAPAAAVVGAVAMLTNAAANNIFDGCMLNFNTTTTNNSFPVYILSGSNNNIFRNNTLTGGYAGIYSYGTPALPNSGNQFTGNIIKDNFYYGVFNSNASTTLIERNDISRPTRTNGNLFYGIFVDGASTEVTISKNRIHNTHDVATTTNGNVYGIYNASAGTLGTENIVKNNAIYNINAPGATVYGIYNGGGSNTWYYHNTVSLDLPNVSYANVRGMYIFNATSNLRVINNIFSLSSTANFKFGIYMMAAITGFVSDNNDLYTPNGLIGFTGGDRTTLADWTAATGTDQHSVSANPLFVNVVTGDLHPSASSVSNIGQPVVSITNDITGAPRSSTTPDPGAFEFFLNPNDVGVVAIAGPSLTGCGLSAAETITVTLKNFGDVTQTTFPVTYSVNGTNPVTETWTGSLASNATTTHTFAAKANLATSGAYALKAYTGLSTDSNHANDTTRLSVTNSLIPTLPVAFDFETAATGISRFRKVTNANSNIKEAAGASNGTGSKGMILDGMFNANWIAPAGQTDPWTVNPDNFAAAYICISPAGGLATDSLWLTFDLKQLFKTANVNTNFRVTVNGAQVGPTYRPPFSGTPINWQKVKVDLTAYKNDPSVMIGLESSVKEAYANATGTANLIDNVDVLRRLVSGPNGTKENALAKQLHVFPNPSNGNFNVSLENGRDYTLKVTDLSGKVILTQQAKGDAKLNLKSVAKGIYLLNVASENGSAVRKLIVE